MAVRIGIAGMNGRMGRMLVLAVRQSSAILVGGIDRRADGADLPFAADLPALAAACDVVIDFTQADAVATHAAVLSAAGCGWVLGTTGMDEPGQAAVAAAAVRIAVVQAANFAPGVNLVLALAERMATALPAAEYDAEIVEMHHRQKLDAPSGTALAMAQAVATGRSTKLAEVARRGRDGLTGARPLGEIGLASLRGGQIVGEHRISFTAGTEQISLEHRAFDRSVFAAGAVQAAIWLEGQPPGLYGMRDVLGV